ncbi:hypothetical protein [Marinobacter sp.]|uniref:hypothetical protein n=1 Tax=Marinobacter sp. TaxID=50741 RepID=UPI00384E719F
MKAFITVIGTSLLLLSTTAAAVCTGSGSFKTCTDNQGNNYTVQKFGNQTYTTGHNGRTGSNWSSNSTTIGTTTFQNGQSADGNTWNQTIQNIGDTQFRSGTDSNGNSFNSTCNQYGCY